MFYVSLDGMENSSSSMVTIQVLDMLGREVYETEADFNESATWQLDLTQQVAGQYLVKVTNGDAVSTQTIVISH